MSLTNEDLLAISQLLDSKFKPIEDRTKNIEILIENDFLTRLQNIESCYSTTYRRYVNGITQLDFLQSDMEYCKTYFIRTF